MAKRKILFNQDVAREIDEKAPRYYDEYSNRYDRASLTEELDPKLTIFSFKKFMQTHPMLIKYTEQQVADQIIQTQRSAQEHARMIKEIAGFTTVPGFIDSVQKYAKNYIDLNSGYPTKETMLEAANDIATLKGAMDTIFNKFHNNEDYREAMMLLIKQYYGKDGNAMIHWLYSPSDGPAPARTLL